MSRGFFHVLLIISIALLIGCSSKDINPNGQPLDVDTAQPRSIAEGEGHFLWGLYDFYIDPQAKSVDVVPIHSADPHFDVTGFVNPPNCDDCVLTQMISFDPGTRVAVIKVTLKNPTLINGFDVRGILLLNNAGHDLIGPDGWVSIFDDGSPPNFNPFMRYGKNNPNGVFPGGASLVEYYRIVLPYPPKFTAIQYAVDAFWPKNGFREPYEISDINVNGTLWDDGSNSVNVSIKAFDRHDDVSLVTIECPGVFSGKKDMIQDGDQWAIEISNENMAPANATPYPIIFEAFDSVSPFTLVNKYRVYIVEKNYFWTPSLTQLPNGECSFDVAGVTGGTYDTGSFMANPDLSCTGFLSYNSDFTLTTPALNLPDINPLNLTLQPYPPLRFDSASGGSLIFSNAGVGTFVDDIYSVNQSQVIVTLDSDLIFKDDEAGDHQAHHAYEASTLTVADVCDGFQERFYALWAETFGSNLPVVCGYEADYSGADEVFRAEIPIDFIGNGDGLILNSAENLLGIDAMEVESSPPYENVRLCVLERTPSAYQVEIFNFDTDIGGSGDTTVTHARTINFPPQFGIPIDIEMLPPNPNYEPLPNEYALAIVFKVEYYGNPAGFFVVFNMEDGDSVDMMGSPGQPSVYGFPRHLDVNNGTFTVIVTSDRGDDVGENNMGVFWFTYG